jgi:hypothetical protein
MQNEHRKRDTLGCIAFIVLVVVLIVSLPLNFYYNERKAIGVFNRVVGDVTFATGGQESHQNPYFSYKLCSNEASSGYEVEFSYTEITKWKASAYHLEHLTLCLIHTDGWHIKSSRKWFGDEWSYVFKGVPKGAFSLVAF